MSLRPHIVLHPKKDKAILNYHPWIFSGAVKSVFGNPQAGHIVDVYNSEELYLASGFYAPESQIRVKLFHFRPDNFENNVEYWIARFADCLQRRQSAGFLDPTTNCYRLIHAEGDQIPGLIADVYNNVLVLQVLSQGTHALIDIFKQALNHLGFENIYVKAKISSAYIERLAEQSYWLSGSAPCPVTVMENGALFEIDFIDGQKTGFFLDQRDNRLLLGLLSKGKSVLNTFAYSGGFSILGLLGGAKSMTSVDISAAAIEHLQHNLTLNQFDALEHKAIVADCFEYLKDMPSHEFDIIILDPPAFAKSAKALNNATRGYKQINLRAIQKIKPGGLIFTFSCSQNISPELFQKIIFGAATDAGRAVRILYKLTQAPDHPINIYHPESEYLKGLVIQVS